MEYITKTGREVISRLAFVRADVLEHESRESHSGVPAQESNMCDALSSPGHTPRRHAPTMSKTTKSDQNNNNSSSSSSSGSNSKSNSKEHKTQPEIGVPGTPHLSHVGPHGPGLTAMLLRELPSPTCAVQSKEDVELIIAVNCGLFTGYAHRCGDPYGQEEVPQREKEGGPLQDLDCMWPAPRAFTRGLGTSGGMHTLHAPRSGVAYHINNI